MIKTITLGTFGAVLMAACLMALPADANAYSNNYCREYTRTVYIGGCSQDAFGTACLQPDGSWMIVGEGLGNDIPANVSQVDYVIRDNNRYITPNRVVYYNTRPVYHRPHPAPVVIWHKNDHRYYRNGKYVNYNPGWSGHGHHHKHKNHHGRGRGHNHR